MSTEEILQTLQETVTQITNVRETLDKVSCPGNQNRMYILGSDGALNDCIKKINAVHAELSAQPVLSTND